MTGDLNMAQNRIKGLPTRSQSGDEASSTDYVLTLINSVSSVFLDRAGSLSMTGSLHMGNKKIITLANPTNNADAANKAYIDDNFLKLSGSTMTCRLFLPTNSYVSGNEAPNLNQTRRYGAYTSASCLWN